MLRLPFVLRCVSECCCRYINASLFASGQGVGQREEEGMEMGGGGGEGEEEEEGSLRRRTGWMDG